MTKPMHPKRHASALRIAASLHRAERQAAQIQNAALTAALKDMHDALADAFAAHGAEVGLGGDIAPFSGGLAK